MPFSPLVVFTSSPFFWLQEVHSQLCSQKAQFQCIMDRLKMKYSDPLAPSEIEGQLQEVTQSLQQLERKVAFWHRNYFWRRIEQSVLILLLGGSGGGEKRPTLQSGCEAVGDPDRTEFGSEET